MATLPEITEEDRQFLHYNPNTSDIVEWVQNYARKAIEMAAQVEPEAPSDEEKFCDSNCMWLDHHPDCTIPVGYLGVDKQGGVGKFRTSEFSGAMPLYAHPPKSDCNTPNA